MKIKYVGIISAPLLGVLLMYFIHTNNNTESISPTNVPETPVAIHTPKPIEQLPTSRYIPKKFPHLRSLDGLSQNQLKQHETLYAGYVKKRNEITQALKTVDRSNVANRTYSPFRSLKTAQTYAVNGSLLHELYFENMNNQSTEVGPQMKQLITQSFGSFDAFKKDFIDCGNCARGWVITAYGIDDDMIHNYVLEEHNQHVPVLCIPLLVLDVYEHAYMIDYGITREPYLTVFWNHIDWQKVEERIIKWVNPLRFSNNQSPATTPITGPVLSLE